MSATSSRRGSNGPVIPVKSAFQRHNSPSSKSFASSTSYYSSPSQSSSGFFTQRRSTSPTRVNLHAVSPPSMSPSVRFTIDRSMSPRRSIAAVPRHQAVQRRSSGGNVQKRTCMCSPTSHPGSFRCALHKNNNFSGGGGVGQSAATTYSPHRLNMRRSAMTNSLVRIGTVEGDLVRRALAALIRPSSHQQRRRANFKVRPSRLSVVSKADDGSM